MGGKIPTDQNGFYGRSYRLALVHKSSCESVYDCESVDDVGSPVNFSCAGSPPIFWAVLARMHFLFLGGCLLLTGSIKAGRINRTGIGESENAAVGIGQRIGVYGHPVGQVGGGFDDVVQITHTLKLERERPASLSAS